MQLLVLSHATSAGDIREVRALFEEYAGSLGFSLCFQGFDQELAGLPGAYAPPTGRLLLARVGGVAAGCVGSAADRRECLRDEASFRPAPA